MCHAELPPGLAIREIEARMAPREELTSKPATQGLVARLLAWFSDAGMTEAKNG